MGRASTLIKRVNAALAKFALTDRVVYKRELERSGGDSLIGRPTVTSKVDTKLDPQPAVMAPVAKNGQMLFNGADIVKVGDLQMLVSPSALTKTDLQNSALTIVMKDDSAGTEEEFFIVSHYPSILEGMVVTYKLLIRSKTRPGT